jgi:ATP-dependent DNA helicase RecG
MSQGRRKQLLMERAHSRRRWENQEAEGTTLRDLNREEVSQAIDSARAAGRLVEPVGRDLGRVLHGLGVRRGITILRAAVALFGKRFLPDLPQCGLRRARFKGTDKTEFLDQRQIRGPAFQLLEEALLFCQCHPPLPVGFIPQLTP